MRNTQEEKMKALKGTTTIGLTYQNGVILAADKRASAGHVVASKTAKKIKPVTENIAITISGSVAGAKILHKWLKAQISGLSIQAERDVKVSAVANLTSTILHSNFRRLVPFQVHFLIGGREEGDGRLFFLDHTGSLQEDDYVASGSGSTVALGILEREYKQGMKKNKAMKTILNALSHSIKRDTFTGDGTDIGVIDEKGFKLLSIDEISNYAEDLDIVIRSAA